MRHSSTRLYSATTLLIVSSEPALTAATANTRCPTMRHNLVLNADLASPTWKSSKSYSMSVGTSARHPGLPLSRSWTSKDIGCRQESRVESGERQALRGVEERRQKQRRKILGAVKSQESRARWKAEGKSTSPCLPPHQPRTVRGVAATQVPQHFPTVSRWKQDWQTRGALNHSIGDPPCTIAFSYPPPPNHSVRCLIPPKRFDYRGSLRPISQSLMYVRLYVNHITVLFRPSVYLDACDIVVYR